MTGNRKIHAVSRAFLQDIYFTMNHAKIFLKSRQRIAPVGYAQYCEIVNKIAGLLYDKEDQCPSQKS